jgi:hypothetical protein
MDRKETCDQGRVSMAGEFKQLNLGDERVTGRFLHVMSEVNYKGGGSLNRVLEGKHQAKAGYRLMNNKKLEQKKVMDAHREKVIERMNAYSQVLIIQDTTGANYTSHVKTEGLGRLGPHHRQGQGLYVHATLASTLDGTPLGVANMKIWARDQLPEDHELWGSEADRWKLSLEEIAQAKKDGRLTSEVIVVCDREADITELMQYCISNDLRFVIRGKKKRLVEDNALGELMQTFLKKQASQYQYTISTEKKGAKKSKGKTRGQDPSKYRKAEVHLRYTETNLRSPDYLKKELGRESIPLNAIMIDEPDCPEGEDEIEWILLTDFKLNSVSEAQKVVDIYRRRWGIEEFFKILKSGCQIEKCGLETVEKLKIFILMNAIVAYRIYYLTRLQRENPEASADEVLDQDEMKVLCLKFKKSSEEAISVSQATRWIARMGGFMDTKANSPPGIVTLWRGWKELELLATGFRLGAQVGKR